MKFVVSIFLICVLNLPNVVGLVHFFEDEHKHCEDKSLHFHKAEINCTTCDYLRIALENDFNCQSLFVDLFNKDYNYSLFFLPNNFDAFIEIYNSRAPPISDFLQSKIS